MNKQKRGKQGDGGGRPRLSETKQRITISLPPKQIAWLKEQKNASETVRQLIAQAMQNPRL